MGARPCEAAASTTCDHLVPAWTVAVCEPAFTDTLFIRSVVISMPSSTEALRPCPVAITATRMPCRAAQRTATATSLVCVAETRAAGRSGNAGLNGTRSGSVSTWPSSAADSSLMPKAVITVLSLDAVACGSGAGHRSTLSDQLQYFVDQSRGQRSPQEFGSAS